ncbi:MAG: acyltransferase [Limnohabitans sp.]|jgi:peptidoglycan/LPS O-acetylase OafA/YrhL|nr:acyltransferase [Limnohabitans sp.]
MPFPAHLFRRVTSTGAFLPELDGLRAVAILPVVLFHSVMYMVVKAPEIVASTNGVDPLRTLFGWSISHGFLGVQLFFAISGFVVTLPFARHFLLGERKPSLRAFYVKRITRIEPPYLIALVLFGVGVFMTARENFRIEDFLAGAVYLRTALFGETPWAFFISWSLEIEVQFYVLAPFLAAIFALRSDTLRRAILVVAIALASVYAARVRLSGAELPPLGGPLQHGSWLGSEIAFFLVGMLVADLWTTRELAHKMRVRSSLYDLAFLAGLVAMLATYRALEVSAWGIALLPLGLFAVLLGAFRGRLVRAVLSLPLVTAIGGACYTIYLLHFLVVSGAGRFLAPFVDAPVIGGSFERVVFFLGLPFALLVTALCLCAFPLLERPFMYGDWPERLWRALRHGDWIGVRGLFAAQRT